MEQELSIITERIDDVPLLLKQLETMQLSRLYDEHFPRHGHWQGLSPGEVVSGWLSFILSESNHRLSHVQTWAAERLRVLSACLGSPVRELDFGDDRLGRVLDQLGDDGRWSRFEASLNRHTLRVYDLSAERVRIDSTSAKSYARIDSEGLLQLGHSKDRRPDLAQVKINLSVLDPLGLPLTTTVVSGDRADDRLYVAEITRVRQSVQRRGVTYIGDCKMAALATRAEVVNGDDYYLCPLSALQLSSAAREQILTPVWTGEQALEVVYRIAPDGEHAEEIAEGFVYETTPSAVLDHRELSWIERRFVVRSFKLAASQERHLHQRLENACTAIRQLNERGRGKKRYRDEASLSQAVEALTAKHQVSGLLQTTYHCQSQARTVRAYGGQGERVELAPEVRVEVSVDETARATAVRSFGWHVYASNHPHTGLSLSQAVLAYRSEYLVERGFARFKGDRLVLTPMYLESDTRITGLIRLLSLALRVLTLIEFKARQSLQQQGQALAGLYPGNPKRATTQPTTEMLLRAFVGLTLTVLIQAGQSQRHITALKPVQQRVLLLLDFSEAIYQNLAQQLFEPLMHLREP